MSLAELIRLCPPPAVPWDNNAPGREDELAAEYGVRFSPDYVGLCRAYGTGRFVSPNTHEIFLYNLFAPHFRAQVEDGRLSLDVFFSNPPARVALADQSLDPTRLFPLGGDTDDALIAVPLDLPEGGGRVVVAFGERDVFEVVHGGPTDLLVGFFTGQLHVRGWEHRMVGGRPQAYQFLPPQR
jgi:hypothetical protein